MWLYHEPQQLSIIWIIQEIYKHSNITHAKNRLGAQGLAQEASQIFSGNTSVQQNIGESIKIRFLNLQQLAKIAYIFLHIIIIIIIIIIFLF